MITAFNIISILGYVAVAVEDFSERTVHWWLFLLLALSGGLAFYSMLDLELLLINIALNLCIVCLILAILLGYSRLVLKKPLFNVALGLGDALLFVVLAVSFPVYAFVVLFAFSVLFSLLLHLLFSKSQKHTTVPLAGYMSIFVTIALVLQFAGVFPNLYAL